MSDQQEHEELRGYCDSLEDKIMNLETALNKINGIRNSIIGMQGFNFSEHAYPLVAALDEAGFEGEAYPEARENLGTLIEQAKAADVEVLRLTRMMVYCSGCRTEPGAECEKGCKHIRNNIPCVVNAVELGPIQRAIDREREACAKLAEDSIVGGRAWNREQEAHAEAVQHAEAAQHIAAAIRARTKA